VVTVPTNLARGWQRMTSRPALAGWAFFWMLMTLWLLAHATLWMVAVPETSLSCTANHPAQLRQTLEAGFMTGDPVVRTRACTIADGRVSGDLVADPATGRVEVSLAAAGMRDATVPAGRVPVLFVARVTQHEDLNPTLRFLDAVTPLAAMPPTAPDENAPSRTLLPTTTARGGAAASWLVPGMRLDDRTTYSVIWLDRARADEVVANAAARAT
jgi:hypothetical protein